MKKLVRSFEPKITTIYNYFFPKEHIVNPHYSVFNHDVLFYTRLFSLLYLSWAYLWCILTVKSALMNIIYLTMQGYFMTWLFFLLSFQDYIINGNGFHKNRFAILQSKKLKYYIQIIYQIAFCIQLPITAVFWGFLFKIIMQTEGVTTEDIVINANLHAGPFIVLCIDMMLNTFRFPKSHFYAVIIFQLLYGIVNFTYSIFAHIIYQPIDWVSVLSYVLMLSTLGLSFFMHWLGRLIFNRCKKPKIDQVVTPQKFIDYDKDLSGEQQEKQSKIEIKRKKQFLQEIQDNDNEQIDQKLEKRESLLTEKE